MMQGFMHEPLQYLETLKLEEFQTNKDVKYVIPKCASLREIYSVDSTSQSILDAVNVIKSNLVSAKQLTRAYIYTSGQFYKRQNREEDHFKELEEALTQTTNLEDLMINGDCINDE